MWDTRISSPTVSSSTGSEKEKEPIFFVLFHETFLLLLPCRDGCELTTGIFLHFSSLLLLLFSLSLSLSLSLSVCVSFLLSFLRGRLQRYLDYRPQCKKSNRYGLQQWCVKLAHANYFRRILPKKMNM